MQNDTIVAIATPEGNGGLSVVRLSGPTARSIAQSIFHTSEGDLSRSHCAVYGILREPNRVNSTIENNRIPIDQVIVLPMWAPRSYTGEDTVEFFCHGGSIVARMVVGLCREAGARPAAAGEFTRRAFLNGKMSLDQAEAVADLIHAESETAARAAIRQLLGGLNRQLVDVEKPLLELLARMEGGLEFLDDEVPEIPAAEIRQTLIGSLAGIDELLVMAPAGRLLREGIHVVLRGEPNTGKSSLFNLLVGEERAIVDNEAGTTRDVVTGRVNRGGRIYVFHDTAGLRSDAGRVEAMGITRTEEAAKTADLILDLRSLSADVVYPETTGGDAVVLNVRTKSDLQENEKSSPDEIWTSSKTGAGLTELWAAIESAVAQFQLDRAVRLGVVLNERHRHKLESCRSEVASLVAEFDDESVAPGNEVTGTILSSILSHLGEVSGRVFSEQLLESVFSRFCIGK